MSRRVFVMLLGDKERGEINYFQQLQQEAALSEGRRSGLETEIVFAPGFDQLRVLRRRLGAMGTAPPEAVVVEPASVASIGVLLKEIQGRTGAVLLNAWSPEVEAFARAWDARSPLGTVSADQRLIGEIQGRQICALLPRGGSALVVTGPLRASAAVERLEGTRAALRPDIALDDTEAGDWSVEEGGKAFQSWYRIRKDRDPSVGVVCGQDDELAVGAKRAGAAVPVARHAKLFRSLPHLGIDACPGYGRKLVDEGTLKASVATPANSDEAVRLLARFWRDGTPLPLRTLTEPTAYPPASLKPRA